MPNVPQQRSHLNAKSPKSAPISPPTIHPKHPKNPVPSGTQPNKRKQEAEKQLDRYLQDNKDVKNFMDLYKAILLVKDSFGQHRLSQREENVLGFMKDWLYKSGAHYDKLKVVNVYPGYRGVIATKHIKKKQPIVFIPKSQLITLQMSKQCQTSKTLTQKNLRLHSPKHTLLSILLLQLKNTPDSKYKPYLDLLPQDHSCFPINYSKNQLQLLEGSPFLNMIYEKVVGLKKDYQAVVGCDAGFGKYSFREFCWVRNMVGSRIFGLVIKGVKTEILVPFADMLNHRHPKQTIWSYDQSMNGFVIQSQQDIEIGQEVFDSYGRKCNSRYLLSYGFTLEDNPDNQISIKLEIDEKDPLGKMKKEIIHENVNQAYVEVRKINFNFHNNKFYEFMGGLRFVTIEDEETLIMLKKISNIEVTKQPYLMVRTPPISIKNEIKIWLKLGELCKQLLSKYPQSLQFDKELIKTNKLTYNQRNIINLRMGEKYILTQFVKVSEEVVKILGSGNVIEALEQNKGKVYAKYLFKILSLTPGINKKNLQKRLSPHFSTFIQQKQMQDTEQIPQS